MHRLPLAAKLPRLPERHEPLRDEQEAVFSLVLAEDGVPQREAVEACLRRRGLAVVAWKPLTRRLQVKGAVKDLEAAFGLRWSKAGKHLVAWGEPVAPPEIAHLLQGAVGLDARPRLRPHLKARPLAEAEIPEGEGSLAPAFAARYGFPEGDGKGQRVGLLQLGGAYAQSDLEAYFKALDLPVPRIETVTVSGGDASPSQEHRWEVALDLQVLGAIVPAAELVLYIAPNSAEGLLDLVEEALKGGAGQPSVLSMSWGAAEAEWGALELELAANAFQSAVDLGVTVLVSSGDEGSADILTDGRQHVNFPASCPWVLGVGGTEQRQDREAVWNALAQHRGATGGGVSDFFDLPDWQVGAGVPGSANDQQVRRGVPDLAAHAAEAGGYRVFVDGQWRVLGGTSAAAPLLAGLLTRLNAGRAKPLGFLNPALYGAAKAAFKPVTEGDNGAYKATAGYSACTGLGVPDGAALLKALS